MDSRHAKRKDNPYSGKSPEEASIAPPSKKRRVDNQTQPVTTTPPADRPYVNPIMKSQLTMFDKVIPGGSHPHSHKVVRVKKTAPNQFAHLPDESLPQRYKNSWFYKKEDADESLAEVVAQEIFRLGIPGQQKTRIAMTEKKSIRVLSKEIPGFKLFSSIPHHELKENLITGAYHGLGDVLVFSLLTNETDLSQGNLCLNDEGQFLKIDGGLCFAKLYLIWARRNYTITSKIIDALPDAGGYEAHNWLDLVSHVPEFNKSVFKEYDFSKHPGIRREINAAILRAIVLPDEIHEICIQDAIPSILTSAEYIEHFKKLYDLDIEAHLQNIHSEFFSRKTQLTKASLQNHSFIKYLNSGEAKSDLDKYVAYLKTYTTIGKRNLHIEKCKSSLYSTLEKLRDQITPKNNPLLNIFKPNTIVHTEQPAPNLRVRKKVP